MPSSPARPEAGWLPSRVIDKLKLAPRLEYIFLHYLEEHFPSMYEPYTEPELHIPPDRWEAEGLRGLIFRRYYDPVNTKEFWHIRALSRAMTYPERGQYVGLRRQWRDFTHYEGKIVPLEVIDKIYEQSGLERNFLSGRTFDGGKIGEYSNSKWPGWKILSEWRAAAGPPTREELYTGSEMGDLGEDSDDDDDDGMDDDIWDADIMDENGVWHDDEWADTDDDMDDNEDDTDPIGGW